MRKSAEYSEESRAGQMPERPAWPMLILQTPKGWTCPKEVDGHPVEDTFHAHQIPVMEVRENPEHLRILEQWLLSYRPHELFDEAGKPCPTTTAICPQGERRIGMNPHANGGQLLVPLTAAGLHRLCGRGAGAHRGESGRHQTPGGVSARCLPP